MKIKRGRGRPKKPGTLKGWPHIEFKTLPAGKADTDDLSAMAAQFHDYLKDRPHLEDRHGYLQQFLDATADSIRAGDAFRTGYYAFGAMRQHALLVYMEPHETAKGMQPLVELADVGVAKLKSDKRRGHRGRW